MTAKLIFLIAPNNIFGIEAPPRILSLWKRPSIEDDAAMRSTVYFPEFTVETAYVSNAHEIPVFRIAVTISFSSISFRSFLVISRNLGSLVLFIGVFRIFDLQNR